MKGYDIIYISQRSILNFWENRDFLINLNLSQKQNCENNFKTYFFILFIDYIEILWYSKYQKEYKIKDNFIFQIQNSRPKKS
jgi:hypothetical protein